MYALTSNDPQRFSCDRSNTPLGRRALSISCAALLALLAGCGAYAPDGAGDETAPASAETEGAISPLGSLGQALVDNEPPADLELRTLKLDEMTFRVMQQQTREDATSITVGGRLWLDTPAGSLPLDVIPGAALTFSKEPSGLLRSVSGRLFLPVPNIGFLEQAVGDELPEVGLGYDTGELIEKQYSTPFPLVKDRRYLYFALSSGSAYQLGGASFAIQPAANAGVVVLDPADPMFTFYADSEKWAFGDVAKLGLGLSLSGQIPFEPSTEWFLDEHPDVASIASFKGHIWERGEIPLKPLPFSIDGEIVVDLDPDDDGQTMFSKAVTKGAINPEFGLGFNGTLELELPLGAKLKDALSLTLEVAKASGTLRGTVNAKTFALDSLDASGSFSGELANPQDLLGDEIPIRIGLDAERRVAGVIGNRKEQLQKSFFEVQGSFDALASLFPGARALGLKDITVTAAKLRVDANGVKLTGKSSSSVHDQVSFEGGADVTLTVPFAHPELFSFVMSGGAMVAGVRLADARLSIDQAGASISGGFYTGVSTISLSGSLAAGEVSLSGSTSVQIPVQTVTDALQTVTDGALCGWDKVNCIQQIVRDGAVCGWRNIVGGGKCVANIIGDGIGCGLDNLGSIFTGGGTTGCNINDTCEPETCVIEQCQELPRSCPQSTHVQISGNFQGNVGVSLDNSGLRGGVWGEYCASPDRCTPIWEGTVSFTPKAQACVSVPVLGNQCKEF